MLYKLCRSWYKRAKTALIVSLGQKRARLEKEYLPFYWSSESHILITDVEVGDLSVRKRVYFYLLPSVINC